MSDALESGADSIAMPSTIASSGSMPPPKMRRWLTVPVGMTRVALSRSTKSDCRGTAGAPAMLTDLERSRSTRESMYADGELFAFGEALPAAARADWLTSAKESAMLELVVAATAAEEILCSSDETGRGGIAVADAWLVLSLGVERERLK